MPQESREVRPFSKPRHVLTLQGEILPVPEDWALLEPGDAALSRRIKEDGPSWTVVEMKGNKRFSRGIWAPSDRIAALRAERMIEQQDPAYQKKLDTGRRRRAQDQQIYAEEFRGAVLQFLNFHPRYSLLAEQVATLISDHAVPVGSGTVARTERIPLEERAEAATIAWMRHQTTGYDQMQIPREKGRRREVRRLLAERSRQLLSRYRAGDPLDLARCPLYNALPKPAPKATTPTQPELF